MDESTCSFTCRSLFSYFTALSVFILLYRYLGQTLCQSLDYQGGECRLLTVAAWQCFAGLSFVFNCL